MGSKAIKNWVILGFLLVAFIALMASTGLWSATLRFLFPDEVQVIHPRASPLALLLEHLALVAASSAITILIGVPLGIWVTRPVGRDFLPIVSDLTSLGQTFPPIAVLALSVPLLGFGVVPTVFALFLYGLMPVVRNTIAGLNAVPHHLLDAAYGMGMGRFQALLKVELPLAMRIILAGIRISVIINIGTAMIGAAIGAGGLGSPIVAGLVLDNLAYVIEGALPAAILAVLVDRLLANVENSFAY